MLLDFVLRHERVEFQSLEIGGSSIHGVFLRNRLYLGHTSVTSFRVQFEKVGRGLLWEGERREGEWAVLAEERGDEERVSVLDNTISHYKMSNFTLNIPVLND